MRESGTSQGGSRNIHRRVIISAFSWLRNNFDKYGIFKQSGVDTAPKIGSISVGKGEALITYLHKVIKHKSKSCSMTGVRLKIAESPFSSADN